MKTNEIRRIFSQYGLTWFVDSGSLLGLEREGHFLKHDHDIDIGIVNFTNNDINKLIDEFAGVGFRYIKFYWGKALYKCKLIPKSDSIYPYILDLQFYTLKNGVFICPQMVFKSNLSTLNRLRKRIIRLKKSCSFPDGTKKSFKQRIKSIIIRTITKDRIEVQNKTSRVKELYDFYYWRIPSKYIDELDDLNGFPAFKNRQDYLKYRYGEWKIPVTKWDFTKDDKALLKIEYSDLYSYEEGYLSR